MSVVIKNGLVATFDATHRLLPGACVRIADDGSIDAVGDDAESCTADTVIDARDCLVMPGLTNAHCHSVEVWARGRTDAMALEPWLAEIFPPLDGLPSDLIRISALLISAEMLKTGVTSVVDHFRQVPASADAVDTVAGAYREAGINAGIAIMMRDRAIPKGRDTAALRSHFSVAAQSELCAHAIKTWHSPANDTSIMLGPSAPDRCSDELLVAIGSLADQHDVRIHMHVDENERQRQISTQTYGCSAVRHLQSLGLLGHKTSLAHCVFVDRDDIDLIASSGTWVIHNPVSNARLGSGIAPIADMHSRGVGIALGTDGAASNDSQNLLEVMKFAALLQPLAETSVPRIPTAKDIAAMATRSGGGLLGSRHGSLETGARADIAIFPLDQAGFTPLNDVYRQLVYAGSGLKAKHVFVGGRHVVDDGKITTFDELELCREANHHQRRIYPCL